jgi:hypothetical protein
VTVLTYRYLGDAVRVGQPLGCDPTGWPYQVVAVEHLPECGCGGEPGGATFGCSRQCMVPVATQVTVEPWPIPGPTADEAEKVEYAAAMAHAFTRTAGVIQ